MRSDIYKFLKNIFYFSVPFIVLTILLVYIDPYNIIRKEKNSELQRVKQQISYRVNYPLFGLQKYDNNPTDIIILGDSRANSINENLFEEVTNKKSTNLAYGGGSIREIIETFWIASKIHRPKEVYIGINFNLYNKFNNKNRVTEANEIRTSIPSYLLSKYCFKSAFLILKSMLTNRKTSIEKPPFARDKFWQYQLDIAGPYFFENYKYPMNYFTEFQKISEYCKRHKIKLTFFIPPTHIDLQSKIKEYKLEKEYKRFIDDLVSFKNPVYDFNFSNSMTLDKNNFKDPFHFNDFFAQIIVGIISGDSSYWGIHSKEYRLFNK